MIVVRDVGFRFIAGFGYACLTQVSWELWHYSIDFEYKKIHIPQACLTNPIVEMMWFKML